MSGTKNSSDPAGGSESKLKIASQKRADPPKTWKTYQKVLFRIGFVFFILMSLPFSSGWYRNALGIDWTRPHYRDIYDIARFNPSVRPLLGMSRGGGGGEEGIAGGNQEPRTRNQEAEAKNGQVRKNKEQGAKRRNGQSPELTAQSPEAGTKNKEQRTKRRNGQSPELTARSSQPTSHNQLASAEDGEVSGRHSNADSGANAEGGAKNKEQRARRRNGQSPSLTAQSSQLTAQSPSLTAPNPQPRNPLADYTDWGIILVISIVAGLIWTAFDRKRKEYNVLYYWLKVVVRYRAAIGIIGFGFTKLAPTQMPFPSLGLLNTDFGDFTAQKIYWLSVGIVPWYQVFGGVVELLAGGLLLFRKTTVYGAILLIGALGDITYVNYAYDGGVHVYAFYFVVLGAFLLIDDVPRLYNLLIRQQYTVPNSYSPYFKRDWLGYTRIGLKALVFVIFFGVLTYTEVINFKYDPYKQPSTAGVKQLRGNYAVSEFRINDSIIPYSPVDSTRWQQATFENWTTLTFKVNKPVYVDPSNGGGSPMRDIQRTFEIAGTAGGQRAFHYYADTIEKVLYLQDKNAVAAMRNARGRNRDAGTEDTLKKYPDSWITLAAWKNIGDENKMIDQRAWSARRDREFARPARDIGRAKMILKYDTTDGSRIVLKGLDENRDSIYVVLDKINRKYNLSESTLKAGKYD